MRFIAFCCSCLLQYVHSENLRCGQIESTLCALDVSLVYAIFGTIINVHWLVLRFNSHESSGKSQCHKHIHVDQFDFWSEKMFLWLENIVFSFHWYTANVLTNIQTDANRLLIHKQCVQRYRINAYNTKKKNTKQIFHHLIIECKV